MITSGANLHTRGHAGLLHIAKLMLILAFSSRCAAVPPCGASPLHRPPFPLSPCYFDIFSHIPSASFLFFFFSSGSHFSHCVFSSLYPLARFRLLAILSLLLSLSTLDYMFLVILSLISTIKILPLSKPWSRHTFSLLILCDANYGFVCLT